MKDTVKVSVIVPVFNGAETLQACVESLLALDYNENARELIFVDNASTDDSAEILKAHEAKLRICFEAKRGPAAARNCGLRAARHEILAMTDADCVVDRHWLQELVQPLRDPSVGLVGGIILSNQPCNAIERFGERIHDHRMAIEVWQPPYVITMNWAARKSALRPIDYFDENFNRCEDVDLSYRLFQTGLKLVYAPKAIVYHRNEQNFTSLFHEGYLHGYYSVQAIKKHRALVTRFGYRRIQRAAYAALLTNLKRSIVSPEARCDFVFNSGKKLGKLLGSIRFRYVDL